MPVIKFRVSTGNHASAAPPRRTPAPQLADPFCRHLGEHVKNLQTAAPCGCDRRIFACPKKGQCVQLASAKAAAKPLVTEARERGLQICAECELFESS